MSAIKLDIEPLRKDLRGLIYQLVNEEMNKFNVKEQVTQIVKDHLKKVLKREIRNNVYSYLEESEIAVQDGWKETKITLNDFITRTAHQIITDRLIPLLNKIDIIIKD